MSAAIGLERLDPAALTDAQRDAWRDLASRAAQPNPFFEPEFVEPAVRHLDGGDRVSVVVARDDDRWLGCFPARAQPKWSRLPFPCVRTWKNPYAFLATPLVDAGAVGDVVAAFDGALGLWPLRAFAVYEQIAGGTVADALLSPDGRRGRAPFAYARVDRSGLVRRPEDTYVAERVSGKRRRELGRNRRRLEEELGHPVALEDVTGDAEALERFLAIEGAGWKGRAGSAMASDPAHERFLRETTATFGALGRLRILELRAGDRALATILCLIAGRTLYTLKIGYDETLASGAPGVLLLTELASWFHAQPDLDEVDSCADPEHPTINRLWPDRREIVTPIVPARGVRGRAVEAAMRALASRGAGATDDGDGPGAGGGPVPAGGRDADGTTT